jgi:F-type H+/Na+-transporting ATPase subunit alpha
LKDVPVDKVHAFEKAFLQKLTVEHQKDVLDVLKKGEINDDVRHILDETAKQLTIE